MSFIWQQLLYRPLLNILIFLYNTIAFKNMGVAIIELTVAIRLILISPSLKALRAQIALQKLQPEIDKIRKKYKDDKQKQNKATMEFYQKNKINPLSSCLPTLIQLPILIALFWIFRDALNSNNMHLLYPFVQNPGQVNTYFLGMNLSNKGNWILAILAAVSQFWQSKMIMPKMQPGAQGMQSMLTNQMIYFMPLITLVFALQFPAGLALYWVTTTVFAVATQWFVLKDSKKENFGEEANKSKSEGRITKFLKKYSEVQKNGRKGK